MPAKKPQNYRSIFRGFPTANEFHFTGEGLAGTTQVSNLFNPKFPLSSTIFVPSIPLLTSVNCLKGPLFSGLNGSCSGTSSVQVGSNPPVSYFTTITEPTTPAGNPTIQIFTASGTSTTPVLPTSPLTFRLPELTSPFGFHADTSDPISTATGGVTAGPFDDLSLGGPLPLTFRRSYQAALGATFGQNPIGYNWTTNFDTYLGLSQNFVVVAMEGGGTVTFQLSGSTYKPFYPPRFPYQLVTAANGYRFMNPEEELIYDFDLNGNLTKIEDRNGNALSMTRGAQGVTQVSDGLGRTLSLTYAVQGNQPTLTKVQDQAGRFVQFNYDAAFNLTGFTDANGATTNYSYQGNLLTKTTRPLGNAPYTQAYDANTGAATGQADSEGDTTSLSFINGGTPGVTVMKDPLGRSTTFNYGDSTLANLTSATDAAGNSSAIGYDAVQRPNSFKDRLGNTTSITYDPASGNPASITDAAGNTTTYTYQAQIQGSFTFYNLVKIAYPDGTSESFTYDASGNVLTEADRAGKKTTYTYDSHGEVLTATNPASGVTTYSYNADETIATLRIPSGDLYTFSYDSAKRVTGIQNPDGTSRTIHYDSLDQVLQVLDERGKPTSASYDSNQNLRTISDAFLKVDSIAYDTDDLANLLTDRLGNQTRVQTDALGSVTGITDATGAKTSFGYDNLERLQSIADSTGKSTIFGYDAEGRATSVTDAIGNTSRAQVDKDGRTTQINSPLGETTNIAYDSMSRITSVIDAVGRQSSVSYEARGLPTTLAAPGGISTTLAWGDLPLLSSVTDPNGNAWPITRDVYGRVTTTTDPLGHTIKTAYNSRNRIATLTSPIDSAQMSYDAANNLTQIQYSDGTTDNFTYDDDNRLTGGTNLSLAYDANGRLTGSNGLGIARDAAGRLASITYASGKTVNYVYDSRGILASVTDWMGGSVKFTFDDAHRLTAETRSNGVVTTYTYDKDSRIASILDSHGNTTLATMALSRDGIGRVTTATRSLPQEATPGAPGSTTANFDAANQIATANYDARGRITNDNAGATYSWSAATRLNSYTRPDGSAAAVYDAVGQRVSRTVKNGATQTFVIDYATTLPTVATVQSGGADVRYYVYRPDGALLFSIEAGSGAHHFYSFDETGSATLLTDDAGNVTDSYGVSPYGDVVTAGAGNSTDNPFTWQGKWGVMQEGSSKLYYARLRYYDAANARFLSRDPLFSAAPLEVNSYQYAAGNPVANGDPTGLKTISFPFHCPFFQSSRLPIDHDLHLLTASLSRDAICEFNLVQTFITQPTPAPNFQSLFWSPGYDYVDPGDSSGDGKSDFTLYSLPGASVSVPGSFGNGGFTSSFNLHTFNNVGRSPYPPIHVNTDCTREPPSGFIQLVSPPVFGGSAVVPNGGDLFDYACSRLGYR